MMQPPTTSASRYGNENDRATALDSLRRADELAPGTPLFF